MTGGRPGGWRHASRGLGKLGGMLYRAGVGKNIRMNPDSFPDLGSTLSNAIYGRQTKSYAGQSASYPLTSTATKLVEMSLFNDNRNSLRGGAFAGVADVNMGATPKRGMRRY